MRLATFSSAPNTESGRKLILLLLLSAAWLLPGLIGHDPWKPEEGVSIGIIVHMLRTGDWLVPTLADEPYLRFGPLYYWTAALLVKALGWAMAPYDAARLASGLYIALAIFAIARASREFFGPTMPRLAVALLIGCVGLLVHAHEMVTDTALLAAYALVLWGLALSLRRATGGGALLGLGIGIAFLSRGLVPVVVILLTVVLLPAFQPWRSRRYLKTLGIGLAVSAPFLVIWPWLFHAYARDMFFHWWRVENLPLIAKFSSTYARSELNYFLRLLPWFAWPVLPIALWTLWGYRKKFLQEPGLQLPLVFFVITFAFTSLNAETRDIHMLPVLLPLVLLAVPGAETLRRGAANALGWFGIMTFGLAALFIWLVWMTLMVGHPRPFYQHILHFQPGYEPHFAALAFLAAILLTGLWFLPLRRSFRSGRRAVFHWAAGITLMWGLAATLLLPWLNHGRSYAALVAQVAQHLPADYDCIGSAGLGEAQRGLLYYYGAIVTQRAERDEFDAYGCDVFLLQTNPQHADARPGEGWEKYWQGSRPGDKSEVFALYRARENAR